MVLWFSTMLTYLLYNNYTIEQQHKYTDLKYKEVSLRKQISEKFIGFRSLSLYESAMLDLVYLESAIDEYLPHSDQLPKVLVVINQMAIDTHVLIISFIPEVAPPEMPKQQVKPRMSANREDIAQKNGKIMSLLYHMQLRASYPDFVKFVYKVAQLRQVVVLTNIHMQKAEADSLRIACDLVVFYSI